MIIKSLSRKDPSFAQLTAYMLAADGAEIAVRHNLAIGASTPEKIVQDFAENYALLPRRANGNALFHEIIALPADLEIPVPEQAAILRDIAEHYLMLRARNQLALGVIHTETAHVHIHLMISSNSLLSRQRAWLSKAEFAAIQREVEAYRVERFPALGTVRHYDQGRQGMRSGTREQAAHLRTGRPSEKRRVAAALKVAFRETRSRAALEQTLAELGLQLYQRGRSVGVKNSEGRRYRLTTLGLASDYAEAMARIELSESRIMSLRKGRVKQAPESERET